jgi:hypothetical protein
MVIFILYSSPKISIEKLDAVIGRGGLLHPIPGGTYEVNEKMKADLASAKYGEHASNLGAIIADSIAKELATYGLKVWINYRSKPELADAVKDEIESAGGTAAVIKADVSVEADWKEMLATIKDSDGQLSYLVNMQELQKIN